MALPIETRSAGILAQIFGAVHEICAFYDFWQLIAAQLQKLAIFSDSG
jgi:hypothetical protein